MKEAFSLAAAAAFSAAIVASPAMAFQHKPTEPTSGSSSSSSSGGSSGGTAVPEPAGIALLGLGLGFYIGGAQMRRRRNKNK